MGLFAFLKQKLSGVSNKQKDKYVVGMAKSRHHFADRLKALGARYREVDDSYFEELEQILIEADVGVP